MKIQALIPFKPVNPKTRLSPVLTQKEREEFARAMISDVVEAVSGAGCSPVLLCTSEFSFDGAEVCVIEEGLNEALNHTLPKCAVPVLIIMSDLPLVRCGDLRRLFETKADVAIVPGIGGGTNIIYVKEPAKFHVQYYGFSFARHMEIAKESGSSSMGSYWLSLMPADRAAEIQRKMLSKPETLN